MKVSGLGVVLLQDYKGYSRLGGITSEVDIATDFLLSYKSTRHLVTECLNNDELHGENYQYLQELREFIDSDKDQKILNFKKLGEVSLGQGDYKVFFQKIYTELDNLVVYDNSCRVLALYCHFLEEVLTNSELQNKHYYFETLFEILTEWQEPTHKIIYFEVVCAIWLSLAKYTNFENEFLYKFSYPMYDLLNKTDRYVLDSLSEEEICSQLQPQECDELSSAERSALLNRFNESLINNIKLRKHQTNIVIKEIFRDYILGDENIVRASMDSSLSHYEIIDNISREIFYQIDDIFQEYQSYFYSNLNSEVRDVLGDRLKMFYSLITNYNPQLAIDFFELKIGEESLVSKLLNLFDKDIQSRTPTSKFSVIYRLLILHWSALLSGNDFSQQQNLNLELLRVLELGDEFWGTDITAFEVEFVIALWHVLAHYSDFRNFFIVELKRDLFDHYAVDSVFKNGASEVNSGCYIATCAYGSYDCPQVWVLRRFRDKFLNNSLIGRLFVKTYYYISPKLVDRFGNSKFFKESIRYMLNPFVVYLNKKGYSDEPYFK